MTLEINKIYNEDCLETMKKMKDNFIDLTVTSPPYDNLRDYKGFHFNFEEIAKELYRVTKLGGVVVWIVGDQTENGTESGTSFKQALFFKEIGFNIHDTMIYEKSGTPYPENVRYYQIFEYMFIFSKGKPKTYNLIKDKINTQFNKTGGTSFRQKDGSLKSKTGIRIGEFGIRNNIWRYITGKNNSTKDEIAFKHPAIFPENLAEDHIISWSNSNDLIYDPFTGSGTTLKMALLNNRNFIGSEISKEYTHIAQQRIQKHQNILENRLDI